jgi:hypothetical protein
MADLETRYNRVMVNMAGNESLAGLMDEEASKEMLQWVHEIVHGIVDETAGVEDETAADEMMAPRLKALRLMTRAIGRWVGETKSLDEGSRLVLWNRAGEQGKILFGDSFSLPGMNDIVAQLPSDAGQLEMVTMLKNSITEGNKE